MDSQHHNLTSSHVTSSLWIGQQKHNTIISTKQQNKQMKIKALYGQNISVSQTSMGDRHTPTMVILMGITPWLSKEILDTEWTENNINKREHQSNRSISYPELFLQPFWHQFESEYHQAVSVTHTCFTVLCFELDGSVVPSIKATMFLWLLNLALGAWCVCVYMCVYVHTVGIPGIP